MGLARVTAGRDLPRDFNVIVEIPANSAPIKYEVDKESGALFVDRFVGTAMHYPCNYGYIPQTIADDGDPVEDRRRRSGRRARSDPSLLRTLQGPRTRQVGEGQRLEEP